MRSTVSVLVVAIMAGVLFPGTAAAPHNHGAGHRGGSSKCRPSGAHNATVSGRPGRPGGPLSFNGTHHFNATGPPGFNETAGANETSSVVIPTEVVNPTSSVADISASASGVSASATDYISASDASALASATSSATDVGGILAVTATSGVASSVEASATSAVASQASSAAGASASGGSAVGKVSNLDPKALVSLHNDYRAQHGADALTWDDTLASYAENWGLKCTMSHSHGQYGENLAASQGDAASLFKLWTDESSEYDASNPQYSHFTQVVWKSSTKLGCALITCPDGTIFNIGRDSTYLICEYDPAGNVVGQFGENVQP